MGHVHKEMLGARLLPFVHPVKGTDLASGHPDLGQSRQPPSKWLLPERCVEKADQLGPVLHPVRVARKTRMIRVDPGQWREPPPKRVAANRDLDDAVGTGERAVRAYRRMMVALRDRHLAGDGVAGALEGVDTHDRGEQRGPDDSAAPGPITVTKRGQDTVGAVHPGKQITDRYTDSHRLVRGWPGEAHQSGLTLRDLVVPRPSTFRPVVSEAGDREHHKPWVELVEPLGGEAKPVKHPRPEVLHKHVSVPDQPSECCGVGGRLEVQSDRLFVAVAGQEIRGLAAGVRSDEWGAPVPRVVSVW